MIDLPLKKVRVILEISRDPVSFETPVGKKEFCCMGDFIEDKESLSPLDLLIQSDLKDHVRKALTSMPAKETEVIKKRYGIGYDSSHTLKEIGSELNVSRERIRQIEKIVLKKLRHPKRGKHLEAFL